MSILQMFAAARGPLVIALCAVLWGTVGIAVLQLYQLGNIVPAAIGFYRLSLAAVLLGALCCAFRKCLPSGRDLAVVALMGAAQAAYQGCYFVAVRESGVVVAALVTLCMAPLWVAALSAALWRERLGWRARGALLLALAGTVLLISAPGNTGADIRGALWACGSALGYAVFVLAGRTLADRHDPLSVTAPAFGVGALLLLPLAGPSGVAVVLPAEGWAIVLYLGALPTALAYLLFMDALRVTSATLASTVTLLEPLVSTLLAALVFGERLGAGGWLGAALLLAALVALTRLEQTRAAPTIPVTSTR
ncbi:DME family drug/metabolite transporter [Deinobacterium chartae]|uniref:DME family drug/metabolite transporter n=1 Tax=Deinobacterium chartae TaxID=521158 RepID=A0A841I0L9_9DEIO|nr:EamA family transporter [Deinobacterium chartae]MBB6097808.1 DME family drug/metabolite transporter [Deinobacterium chartae]